MEEEIGVHYANSHNTALFTDCCNVAIRDNELTCPRCGKHVVGSEYESEADRRTFRRHIANKNFKLVYD